MKFLKYKPKLIQNNSIQATKTLDSSTPEPSSKVNKEKPAPTKDKYDIAIESLQDSVGALNYTDYHLPSSGNFTTTAPNIIF